MNPRTRNILFILMILSYLFSGGACINGVFNVISGGLDDPRTAKMFIICICFFISAKILKNVLERNK